MAERGDTGHSLTEKRILCAGCMREIMHPAVPCPFCKTISIQYSGDEHDLPPYTRLANRYIIGKRIGSGGFGRTYVAWDEHLNQRFAVKELFPLSLVKREGRVMKIREDAQENARKNTKENVCALSPTERLHINKRKLQEIRSRFQRQTNLLVQLRDIPGLVRIYDSFSENGTEYQVLELLEGMDLKSFLLGADRRLTMEQTLRILLPVMNTVEEMHKRNILHLDLSADNIMILKNYEIRLIDPEFDFTLQDNSAVSQSGENYVRGIMRKSYSPPEQAQGKSEEIGTWSDVYALAVCMYYCITGRFPTSFEERLSGECLRLPSSCGVKISSRQERALIAALAPDYKRRTRTISEFRKQIMPFLKYL